MATFKGQMKDKNGNVLHSETDAAIVKRGESTVDADLTTVEGKVTTAEGKITTLEGGLGTAQGNITTMQGDITTLQGSVGALESAINNIPIATAYHRGVVQVGDGLSVDEHGLLSAAITPEQFNAKAPMPNNVAGSVGEFRHVWGEIQGELYAPEGGSWLVIWLFYRNINADIFGHNCGGGRIVAGGTLISGTDACGVDCYPTALLWRIA